MKIEYKGKFITNFSDWKQFITSGKEKKHWKEGRSACSLTDYITNNNGEAFINKEVSKVIGEHLTFELAYPEYVVKFDTYRGGRVHDLGIYGKTATGKTVFQKVKGLCFLITENTWVIYLNLINCTNKTDLKNRT